MVAEHTHLDKTILEEQKTHIRKVHVYSETAGISASKAQEKELKERFGRMLQVKRKVKYVLFYKKLCLKVL